MNTDVEFYTPELDVSTLVNQRLDAVDEMRERQDRLSNRIWDDLVNLNLELRRTSLPEMAVVTADLNVDGDLTITIENLDSFADATEIMTIFEEKLEGYWASNYPTVEEYPEKRKKVYFYPYIWASRSVWLRLLLDEEARGCVVVEVEEEVDVPLTRAYTKEKRVTKKMICPGQPGYDRYLEQVML